ncbi:MAG TPA: phosphodiester glycosidase family protein [Thermoanaerobaculia bacterium]|nr:phosphodiester glycosidase family protein [Thermoanaerobaculia bacterium]
MRMLVALLVGLLAGGAAPQQPTAISWRALQPGLELAIVAGGGGPLYVVRVDPTRAKLAAGLASKTGRAQTAAEWCRTARFSVAINLGMYDADHRTHTGYLRDGAHVNNAKVNDYRSVLALRPSKSGLPPALWVDLASAALPPAIAPYELVVQNLRLIAGDRRNVWAPTNRSWSEAALAIDSKGRLLFLFSRAPYSMPEFNELLLRLPLDVRQAMHVEGGPEASLSIHAAGVDLDLCGSFETGFVEDESNRDQWPLPNVLGVLREDAAK